MEAQASSGREREDSDACKATKKEADGTGSKRIQKAQPSCNYVQAIGGTLHAGQGATAIDHCLLRTPTAPDQKMAEIHGAAAAPEATTGNPCEAPKAAAARTSPS